MSYPRADVKIEVDGWSMPPFMGLTSWAGFTPAEKPGVEAMVMGDLVLFEDEVNDVMSAALSNGLQVTALHNHFFFDKPEGRATSAAPLLRCQFHGARAGFMRSSRMSFSGSARRPLPRAVIALGWIEGVAEAVAPIVKIIAGCLGDRAARKKPLIAAGYTISTLAQPLFAVATSPIHAVFVRALDRSRRQGAARAAAGPRARSGVVASVVR